MKKNQAKIFREYLDKQQGLSKKLENFEEYRNGLNETYDSDQNPFYYHFYRDLDRKSKQTETEEVENLQTFVRVDEARSYQDIEFRNKIMGALEEDISSRKRVRKCLLEFYIAFTSVVTLSTFWVIIDPVSVVRDRQSYYPLSLKITLATTFLVNVLAIIIIMVKYAFSSDTEKKLLQSFDGVGNYKVRKNNGKKL